MTYLSDLLAYARSQARIERIDYFDPRCARADEVSAWRSDLRERDRMRQKLLRAFPGRLSRADSEELIPGRYGRLEIDPCGSFVYVANQYAALEVYGAVLSYLEATNA